MTTETFYCEDCSHAMGRGMAERSLDLHEMILCAPCIIARKPPEPEYYSEDD